MTKYSLVMTQTPCRVVGYNGCITYLFGLHIHAMVHLLTYLLTYTVGLGNISETVDDRAKFTINGIYKIVHGLSIAAQIYDIE